ncbi:serine/threonine protein kinase [Microcoleus sp. FACHB-672]|uniref:serine/threonine protein kinase n=1 Tax=Microcoleus sp. FACHB-672 TaxID=2692825 RepID=UPI0016888233|nr:serine/threonine-protein kinase [Microcoleus sp. FACHB-672]MBD2039342.1 serine/threonine protein kinase [Microcoleus sp. FACHB-672]
MEPLHQMGDIIAERYRLTNILGQGGIGITYEAEGKETGKRVALKEVSLRRLTDWKVLELFEREARVLSELNHPSIPAYLDYFQVDTPSDRSFYLVQEIAPGKSLAALVEVGWRASEGEAQKLAIRVLEILSYLHSLTPPVIHRDIKPQNIILAEGGRVSLVDFGAVQDTYRHTFAGSSTVVGTYGYMAPEQFRCQAEPATDLYGLGATLLFLLTHQSPADLPQRRLKIEFRSQVQISDDFAGWIETLIEPAVEDRFTSAKEALAVLLGEREMIYPRASALQQPAGSRIVVNKTASRLVVEIPPSELRFSRVFIKLSTLICKLLFFFLGLHFGLYMLSEMTSVYYARFLLLALLILVFSGLDEIASSLFSIVGTEQLDINLQTFRLRWRLLGLSYQVQGRAKNVQCSCDLNGCALVEELQVHRFGSKLMPAEKEWLVAELNNFLGKPLYK